MPLAALTYINFILGENKETLHFIQEFKSK